MTKDNIRNMRRWCSFDIESSGVLPEYALQPWAGDKSWLTSAAVARIDASGNVKSKAYPSVESILNVDDGGWWKDQLHVELRNLLQLWATSRTPIVGWNVAFDAAWLIKMGFRDYVMRVNWVDAMLMWKHLTRIPESDIDRSKRKRYGLKEAVKEFMPQLQGYEDDVDFHDMSPEMVKKRLLYNRIDAGATLHLARRFMNLLNQPQRKKQLRNMLIESKSIPLVADSYVSGLFVDEENCVKLAGELTSEAQTLKIMLEARGATEQVLKSPTKLRTLLFDEWKLPVIKETPKGVPSTDATTLYELSFIDERAKLIQRHREALGLKTKFVDKILESCAYNGDGTTHPTANIYSTYTGRMTFASSILKNKDKRQTGFAVHQMKRDKRFRQSITVPDGWELVEWDAAGQEYRWVAIEANDPVMLSLCEVGEDPHSYMAAQMNQMDYKLMVQAYESGTEGAYEKRMAGKVGNLSCQYRIGPKSLLNTARVKYGFDWDIGDAQHTYNTYHSTYRQVKIYWARKIAEAQRKGYAETIAGRRVIIEGQWRGPNSWMLESTAINFPIQGVGADQKYLAMAAIKPLLTKYGGKFYFELHDGLYAIFPKKVSEKAAYKGRDILSNLPYKKAWGYTPPIPLPWDMKIGPNWGDLEEKH